MVTLRLTRLGVKNQPKYRIVAIDSRKKRDGKYIEEIGFYDPTVNPFVLKINTDRYDYWVGVGAIPSQTVDSLKNRFNKAQVKKKQLVEKQT